jgi:hypothetical protein
LFLTLSNGILCRRLICGAGVQEVTMWAMETNRPSKVSEPSGVLGIIRLQRDEGGSKEILIFRMAV